MIKKVTLYEDLPIEEGKSYVTRFQTGESFFVKRVVKVVVGYQREKVVGFEGIYWKCKHLGLCPLAIDRLIPERVIVGEKIVCDDPEFDLTDLLKKAFEAGQVDKGNNWYGGDVNQYLQTLCQKKNKKMQ